MALLGDCSTGKTQIINALLNDLNIKNNQQTCFNENYNV